MYAKLENKFNSLKAEIRIRFLAFSLLVTDFFASKSLAAMLKCSGTTSTHLWLISNAGLGFRFGLRLGFKILWLHSIMQNMFPLTWTQIWIRIPFPNSYCTHFRDRSLSLLHTFQSGDQILNPSQWKNRA